MTRKDLQCVHEPFGDAYYFGPERLGYRYEGPENQQARQESGYVNSTFRSIFDRIAKDNAEVRTPPLSHDSVQIRLYIVKLFSCISACQTRLA